MNQVSLKQNLQKSIGLLINRNLHIYSLFLKKVKRIKRLGSGFKPGAKGKHKET